ncbi:MAG: hypothetical protein IID38_02320 [Planctomycetes bacterium]|nr:hypothetical protein [Planctomycetota bacterium]
MDGVEIDLRRHDSTVISDAIELKRDSIVSYRVKSDLPISGHAVTIDLAGVKLPVDLSGPDIEGTTWSGKAKVSDYFEIGPGLYRITWQSGNGKSCAATALVKVEGNPFESLPGITATTFMVIGGVGFTLTVGALALSKIVVTLRVFVGGRIKRGQRRTWVDRLLPGTKWSLRDTIRGTLLATAFGIGYSVFVQQAAIAPLSFELTVKVMLPSLLIAPGLSSLKLLDRVIYQSEQR